MSQHSPCLIFSADDQATFYRDGGMHVRPHARIGALTAVDFSQMPPRVWHEEEVPCSVIGPPTCIAATSSGQTILVAGAMRPSRQEVQKLEYGQFVTRLRLDQDGLKKVMQIEVGSQPSGVTLAGNYAYVTLRAKGVIARLDLSNDKLAVNGRFPVAQPEDSLSHLALSPDHTRGLASLHLKGCVVALRIGAEGLHVTQEMKLGPAPYDIKLFSQGIRAIVADTRSDQIAILARTEDRWNVEQELPVGHGPEGIAISPDECWVAVSCFEGTNSPGPHYPWHNIPSRIYLFTHSNGSLTPHSRIEVDSMPQSAVFTPDGKYLVVGQYGLGNLRVFHLSNDKRQWIDTGLYIEIPGQPAALAMAGAC